jgi:hypothetical protein
MRWKSARWLVMAAVLTGCRRHPVVIAPIPVYSNTESAIEVEISSPTTPAEPVTPARAFRRSRRATRIAPHNPDACKPAGWRNAPNNAFGEHETWPFSVHWGLVTAGKATLAVEGVETIRQRPAYHISMDITATGTTASLHPFRDRTDSWLDKASLTTLLLRHSVRESHYQADETALLDQPCRQFKQRSERLDKDTSHFKQGPLPPDALDVYGALFYLRTLPLAVGEAYELGLFAGGRAVPVTATVSKQDTLNVGAGRFQCFLIEVTTRDPQAAKKLQHIRWWVSTDAAHTPVRIRMDVVVGHVTADLEKLADSPAQ